MMNQGLDLTAIMRTVMIDVIVVPMIIIVIIDHMKIGAMIAQIGVITTPHHRASRFIVTDIFDPIQE
jgi:hypothetical protein